MENDVLKRYNEDANHLVAKVLRYVTILIFVVDIASLLNIFSINRKFSFLLVSVSLICALLPTLLFDILNIHKIWAEYFVLATTTFYVGLLYAFLSYHVVIAFVFPIILASLYNKKENIFFVGVLTVPTLIISHFVALHLKMIPGEPLVTISDVVKFGILPRSIGLSGCAIICIAVSNRMRRLLDEVLGYGKTQKKQKEILHRMIETSENLLSAQTYQEATQLTADSVKSVLMMSLELEKDINYEAGYCLDYEKNFFYLLHYNHGEERSEKCVLNDSNEITGELDWTLNLERKIIYQNNYCLMQFYSKDRLLGFVKVILDFELHNSGLVDIMHIAYNNAAKIMTNIELNYHMFETQKRLVQSLAMISESKSEQTGQHINRVGEYMKVMGQELGLCDKECDILSLAAMLHDVGKMVIPSEILEKPGKLTPEEFELIKSHVVEGRNLLEGCPGEMMELGKEIAYQHHEKWDGTGYLKKKGEEINEYATYVAVVDVFDALISKRSYKAAWNPKDAYDEIVNCSGTHFSPKAVDLFKKVYPELLMIAQKYPDTILD